MLQHRNSWHIAHSWGGFLSLLHKTGFYDLATLCSTYLVSWNKKRSEGRRHALIYGRPLSPVPVREGLVETGCRVTFEGINFLKYSLRSLVTVMLQMYFWLQFPVNNLVLIHILRSTHGSTQLHNCIQTVSIVWVLFWNNGKVVRWVYSYLANRGRNLILAFLNMYWDILCQTFGTVYISLTMYDNVLWQYISPSSLYKCFNRRIVFFLGIKFVC